MHCCKINYTGDLVFDGQPTAASECKADTQRANYESRNLTGYFHPERSFKRCWNHQNDRQTLVNNLLTTLSALLRGPLQLFTLVGGQQVVDECGKFRRVK
jgi:hypothetical protein